MEAQLGISLDKSLQCSAWGSRPLSPEQMKYAALDAAVLLMLLDSIIAAALPSKALPASDAESRHNASDGEAAALMGQIRDTAGAQTQSEGPEQSETASLQCAEVSQDITAARLITEQHLRSTGSPGAWSDNGTASQDSKCQRGQHEGQRGGCSASGATEMTGAVASLSLDPSGGSAASLQHRDAHLAGAASPPAASAAQLQEAAQVWGIRLEAGGGCRQRPRKLSKDKRPGVREQFQQDSAGSGRTGERLCCRVICRAMTKIPCQGGCAAVTLTRHFGHVSTVWDAQSMPIVDSSLAMPFCHKSHT